MGSTLNCGASSLVDCTCVGDVRIPLISSSVRSPGSGRLSLNSPAPSTPRVLSKVSPRVSLVEGPRVPIIDLLEQVTVITKDHLQPRASDMLTLEVKGAPS